MDAVISKLLLSLNEKKPALLLGAGFSVGAKNTNNEDIPLAGELTKRLYEKLFIDNPPKNDMLEDVGIAKGYSENANLKDICTLLAEEGRKQERDNVITKCFLGSHVEDTSSHYNLTFYKWNKIFTLNVDDLVEQIYREKNVPLTVWSSEESDRRNGLGNTVLVKLHGTVTNPTAGYVFDENEYVAFYNEASFLLRDFGDAYVKGDMIFIGTQYQENDLKQIISAYENSGYDTSLNNYFFIVPSINDPILKRRIAEKSNFYHISWKTEQFLNFLRENIIEPKEIKQELSQKGLIILDDYKQFISPAFESKLYTGAEPRIEDFLLDWDIIHPGMDSYINRVLAYKKPVVAAVLGKNYVGKTCFAYRVMIELGKHDYYILKFDMKSSEYINLFAEYLKTLPKKTKVAVLFENAAFYYNLLYRLLMCKCPSNIEHLVIVTTEVAKDYYVRRDILEVHKVVEIFKLNLDISYSYARNIYDKLSEKNWLNRPTTHGNSRNEIVQYAYDTNDIIEFLYNITNGRGFEQHYEDLIINSNNEVHKAYLQMLSLLSILGVTQIPLRIFPKLLVKYKKKFEFRKFVDSFEEIVIIVDNQYIKLRCQRLLQNVLMKDISIPDRKTILLEVVKQIVGQFNEGDINELSEIFQRVLSVKGLLYDKIMDIGTIRTMLNELEDSSSKYSYYWIQRGLAAQKQLDYDMADNYFRAAIKVREKSYQAHHALAKNLMERAIDSLRKGDGYAIYYMSEGENEIKQIIDNPAFSRGMIYSLHTYIDMKLKYVEVTGNAITNDDIVFMLNKIVALPKGEVDIYMKSVITKLLDYAKTQGLEDLIRPVVDFDFGIEPDRDKDAYEIENLELDV